MLYDLYANVVEDGWAVEDRVIESVKFKENNVIVENLARSIRYLEHAQSGDTK